MVFPGSTCSSKLLQLLLFARMRLLLAWFRRALVLRSRSSRGLSRFRLRSWSCCGLRPLRGLSWTALGSRSGLRTGLLRRFRGMLDRCRLTLRPGRSCRPGCGSRFGFVDGFCGWARFGRWPRGCRLCLGPWSRLVFRYRTRCLRLRFVDWLRSWARLRNRTRGRLRSRHRTRLIYVHRLCAVRRNRVIEVRD
jgi:hypothetical protein